MADTDPTGATVLEWALAYWRDALVTWGMYADYYRREYAKAHQSDDMPDYDPHDAKSERDIAEWEAADERV